LPLPRLNAADRPREGVTGSQGHASAIFRRAVERGNVVAAELAARELGRLDLPDALELTALVAVNDRPRSRRLAARWLRRWLDERGAPTIDEAVVVAGLLAALGGEQHGWALSSLREVSSGASGDVSPRAPRAPVNTDRTAIATEKRRAT
jgi:hypothetical protein